ncbi:squalene/phytoene synthase family protein [Patescibacteria group bacterium]|nr:squalene/phytoene synthase family protein [Patescibacteria group bacterium]
MTDTRAYEYAKALGEAMQLTNFLRDIREDYVKL